MASTMDFLSHPEGSRMAAELLPEPPLVRAALSSLSFASAAAVAVFAAVRLPRNSLASLRTCWKGRSLNTRVSWTVPRMDMGS